jgi:hypothetical protein
MSNPTIFNASSLPINLKTGSVPDVSGALQDYYQPMTFGQVTKTVVASQLVESVNEISFQGTWQPFTERQLALKPEGQRAWSWFWLHAQPVLTLQVDDIVIWNGKQTRVMSRKDYGLYGYVEYTLVQDWTGAGP